MVEIIQNKNSASRFQILVEIAANQPNIQQKEIAARLNISRQAVSQYIERLIENGMVISDGRSRYTATNEAVNWILKNLRELDSYISFIRKAVTNITTCAAIAEADLKKGQTVILVMENGILMAKSHAGLGAQGIAVTNARQGEDVGIASIEGIVPLDHGKVTILTVPTIQKGGSSNIDLDKLKSHTDAKKLSGAIGIEALVALRKASIEPLYFYGVTDAAIEASYSGIPFLVVCTDDDVPGLINNLNKEKVVFDLLDISLHTEEE
ncbi:winged helix-turn-helix transcriptional regulator [Chloroflexota bacterium]